MVDWTTFKQTKFPETLSQIHVDTRDFAITTSDIPFKFDISKIKNYPDRFFHTLESVKTILGDLYNRSGGESEWRCLWFLNEGEKFSQNWNLKYLRVYKTEMGFVICGNDNKALPKDIFNSNISKEILNLY